MEEKNGIRINKYLSEYGICSRRQADKLIEAGAVLVNGVAATPGMKVTDTDVVLCQGVLVRAVKKQILIMLNKPEGIECTTDAANPDNIVDFVGYPTRIYPVGRLDKNSCGLILLSNDGTLANNLMRAANYHEKEYVVTVNQPVTKPFLTKMAKGVHIRASRNGTVILDAVTRPCKVWAEKENDKTFHIILTQGLNRQIRRMCDALGYQVIKLKRVRIVNIKLGTLPEGKWQEVPAAQIKELEQQVNKGGRR
jgi:23S rRNA pseudouridine2604 synthase